ncbi:MAG: hypothetical protein R3B72_31775 [Polyangiaceae bacterium]
MTRSSLLCLLALAGCNGEVPLPPEPPRTGLGFDTDGGVVRFDLDTGALLARVDLQAGPIRDLAVDPFGGEVMVLEGDDDEGAVARRLSPDLVVLEEQPIDGRVEAWFAPEGWWLFEETYGGERWRLAPSTGEWSPALAAPVPRSLWRRPGIPVEGLGRDGDHAVALQLCGATDLRRRPLPDVPWEARACPLDRGLALAHVEGEVLRLERHLGGERTAFAIPLPKSGRLRQLLCLDDAVAALVDGPPRLVVAPLAASRASLGGSLTLPAPLANSRRVATSMIPNGPDRLLVATREGVVAVSLAANLRPELDRSFEGDTLRGPLTFVEETMAPDDKTDSIGPCGPPSPPR